MNDDDIVPFAIFWLRETDDPAAFLEYHIDILNNDTQELQECSARAS
jgi:hypothetical protein